MEVCRKEEESVISTLRTISYFLLFAVAIQCNHATGMECGRVNLIRPLIRDGNPVQRNEWPFLVAVYEVMPIKFICGGTLISNRHVLTAAHCVHRRHSNVKLSADDIKVRFGTYNLTLEDEMGAEQRSVSAVHVHPDWQPYADKFDADLAILVVNETVTFSIYIQPICIPTNDVVIDGAVIDVSGTVVGWGLADGTKHEDVPRKIVATTLTNSLCYRSEPSIVKSSSLRSFCARGQDGTPNKGDSGGGFFVLSKSSWVQYGIVSAIHNTSESFSIYTNLKAFKRFIVDTVTEWGSVVGESTMKVNLTCAYSSNGNGEYTCQFTKLKVRYEHNEIDTIDGIHVTGKGNENVESMEFNDGFMFTLPDGLGRAFENVKIIRIGNLSSSVGLRRIWRSSLQNFKSLIELHITRNDIELLDDDCLWDLPNLETFRLVNNSLGALHEETFARNEGLLEVLLSGNKLETLPSKLFTRNAFLDYINLYENSLKTIDGQMFQQNTYLTMIDLSANRLDTLPRNLFKNNFILSWLGLAYNSLTALDEQIFHNNSYLETVFLSGNGLIHLPKKLFEKCAFLEEVYLDQNALESIDEQMFANNFRLKTIYISSNRLEYLPKDLFKGNSALKFLIGGNNSFQTLNEHIFAMNDDLRQINFAFNRLVDLPRDLLKNKFLLKTVHFESNSLTALHEQFFETNYQLQTVHLNKNKLESLPKHLFRNNSLLRNIFFDDNNLQTLNEETFETNVNLKVVSIGSNRLEYLDKNLFKNNFDIVSLNLTGNRLVNLDEHLFVKIVNLKFIGLSSNVLESLPRMLFRNNSQLEVISLYNNSITVVDESTFETNWKLRFVGMTGNFLQSLPRNLFRNNSLLDVVSLSENSFRTIDERIFESNPKLENVFLTSNQLEYLPRNLFKSNPLLKELHLKQNRLRIIDIDFTKFGNLKLIELSNNTCVDAIYDGRTDASKSYVNHQRNLTEFQNVLSTNCSTF